MDAKVLSKVGQLTNDELLARVRSLVQCEREATAALIAHLAELDARRLYLAEGYSSLFTYCTQVLHLSEHAAYGRIEAARLIRRFPVLLDSLQDGSATLTTVRLIGSLLTPENHRELLKMTRHKSKREVEELLARLDPQPPVPPYVRRLPVAHYTAAVPSSLEDAAARPADDRQLASLNLPAPTSMPPPVRPAVVTPLAPQRYKIQFTASAETVAKLRLARHSCAIRSPTEIPRPSSSGR